MMNTEKSYTKLFNLFYIFVCIVWSPFQQFILHVDGLGRTIEFLSTVAVLLNLIELKKHKEVLATPAFRCWVILLCYSMVNSLFKGFYAEFGAFQFYRFNYFHPIIFLVIMMVELHRDKRTALKVIWLALGVYILLGLPNLALRLSGRFGVAGLGNLYPLHAATFLFVSAVLLVEGRMKIWLFAGLTLVISVIILFSGTRKAFGAEVIILLGVIWNYGKKNSLWSWIRIILLGGVLVAFVLISMTQSTVGQRIEEGVDVDRYVRIVENESVNDFLITVLDDRGTQYANALDLFHQHFWTGAGLTNYKYLVGSDFRLHSEYMVQLSENGIIGFVLLMLFYAFIIVALRKNQKKVKSRTITMALFGLAVILFLDFTAWTYCQNFTMVFYAIILTYAYSKSEDNLNPYESHISAYR